MQEIDAEQQYNIKGDGVTDNTAALMAMRSVLAGRGNKAVRIILPHGIVKYTDNRWLFGIERFELDSKGLTQLLVDFVGNDDVRHRPIFVGEMFQNNTLTYTGTKEYESPTLFAAALAGSTEITLLSTPLFPPRTGFAPDITDNTRFFEGAYLLLFYYNQVGEGYPPGARYWERVQIKSIKDGIITLETPLVYSYRTDVWTVDRNYDDGLNVGQPALISLDRPQNVQCKYAKVSNVKALTTTGNVNGYWAITADTLELHNIKNPRNPYWPQENTTRATYIDCEFNSSEHDKLTGLVENIRTTVIQDINNGGGCKRIILDGCNTGESLQIVSPYITYRNGIARANKKFLRKDEDDNDVFDTFVGCFDEYPSRAPREEVVIENYVLTHGPQWDGDAYIRTGEHVSHTIAAVSGKTIVLPYIDIRHNPARPGDYFTYSSREVQSWKEGFALFKDDGSNGGKITRIYADPTAPDKTKAAVWVDGTWLQAPKPGEVWKWSPVKTLIDNGGIRKALVDDTRFIPLWSDGARRWQGNTSRGDIKRTVLNFSDLNAGVKRNSQTWVNTVIEYNAFIISIDVDITLPNAGGTGDNFLQITTNSYPGATAPTPRIELGRINFGSAGLRRFDQIDTYGMQRPGDRKDNALPLGFIRDIEFYHPNLSTNPPANGTITITWQTF